MAIKKTELYSSLWAGCDALRGGMDASQYKDYVLTLLFVKYVSDKAQANPDALIEVPEDGSFAHMLTLKHDKEIGDKINIAIGKLAEPNDLKGVIDVADFNDQDKLGKGKAMIDRLTDLLAIFEGLNLGANRADGDDLLGDAYEYLMRNFATESGKSKGQFYTPAEVSRILAKVVGITPETSQDATVYDPTCGSGSLLLKVAEQSTRGLSLYGQEMDNATSALARMNMILHGSETAEIWQDNTLSSPHWTDEHDNNLLRTFDFAVANPPFSFKAWATGLTPDDDQFGRFEYGIPPDKNGDYAFLLHILKSLKSTGKGAVILPHGVLFRGNVESDIRRELVRRGYIKGIIGLPANLFYGTGIPACIIVLDKENATARTGIFMIDAGKGFIKDGNKNRLREMDIHRIVDVFNSQSAIDGFARMVDLAEIEKNDFNLNIPRYIDSSEAEDIQDIEAHLQGGIPKADIAALQNYWDEFPSLQAALFEDNERSADYLQLTVVPEAIKSTILEHPEFTAYMAKMDAVFTGWQTQTTKTLKALKPNFLPKKLIFEIGESILAAYQGKALLDPYDVYQHVMDYWSDIMQDDAYLIAAPLEQDGGWQAIPVRILEKNSKGKEIDKGWRCDLVPKSLVIARYFADEQQQIENQTAALENLQSEKSALEEEHSGEDGAFSPLEKVNKGNITKRLKEIKGDKATAQEGEVLQQFLDLLTAEAAAKKDIKTAETALDNSLLAFYPTLDEDQIKQLVVDDKWMAALARDIASQTDRLSQRLAGRIKQLAERYGDTLPELEAEAAAFEAKVKAHLAQMGF